MEYTKGEWKVTNEGLIWAKQNDGLQFHHRIALLENSPEVKANANLIAASPELCEALKAQHEAIDILFAMLIVQDKTFFPSKSGKPWEAIVQGNAALAKVEGKGS